MDIRQQTQDRSLTELRQPASGPGLEIGQSLQKLESIGVQIPNNDAVVSYLDRHSDMFEVVEAVAEAAVSRFPEAKLSLEVFSAHRNEELDEYLTLYIWKSFFDDTVYEVFDSISEQFSSDLSDKSGWIHLTYDFRPR